MTHKPIGDFAAPRPAHPVARHPGHLAPQPLHPDAARALVAGCADADAAVAAAFALGQLLAARCMAPGAAILDCKACGRRGVAVVAGTRRCLLCGVAG